jgi:outer membrane protein TolC
MSITGLGKLPALAPIDFNGYENLIRYLGGISDEAAAVLYGEFWKRLAAANPSLIKAGLNSRRAEQNLTRAKWDYAPTVSASVSPTGLSYSSDKGLGTSVGGFSINGRIPLDFWVMANNVEKSKIALESAALDYISQESALEIELQAALLNTIAQAGTVLSAGRSLEYAEKHFEYVMERYRLSQSSVSDLLDATALAGNSRNQLIKSRYGFLQSLSKLRSLGAVDDESILLQILMGDAQ